LQWPTSRHDPDAVEPGSCRLGSNGSGKTTLIRFILGLTPAASLSTAATSRGCRPHEVIAAGIACIPEDRKVFPKLTVEEICASAPTRSRRKR
jgi:branched-chain amino acid transport system ATP-binding protein